MPPLFLILSLIRLSRRFNVVVVVEVSAEVAAFVAREIKLSLDIEPISSVSLVARDTEPNGIFEELSLFMLSSEPRSEQQG